MGRGLSIIQKRILLACLRKRFVLYQELLTIWGVQPGAVVDKGKYNSAHASLSRSLTRLFFRNLIQYWQDKLNRSHTAISLTSAGKSMAESITLEENESG
jgi:hypothetical protein